MFLKPKYFFNSPGHFVHLLCLSLVQEDFRTVFIFIVALAKKKYLPVKLFVPPNRSKLESWTIQNHCGSSSYSWSCRPPLEAGLVAILDVPGHVPAGGRHQEVGDLPKHVPWAQVVTHGPLLDKRGFLSLSLSLCSLTLFGPN